MSCYRWFVSFFLRRSGDYERMVLHSFIIRLSLTCFWDEVYTTMVINKYLRRSRLTELELYYWTFLIHPATKSLRGLDRNPRHQSRNIVTKRTIIIIIIIIINKRKTKPRCTNNNSRHSRRRRIVATAFCSPTGGHEPNRIYLPARAIFLPYRPAQIASPAVYVYTYIYTHPARAPQRQHFPTTRNTKQRERESIVATVARGLISI